VVPVSVTMTSLGLKNVPIVGQSHACEMMEDESSCLERRPVFVDTTSFALTGRETFDASTRSINFLNTNTQCLFP